MSQRTLNSTGNKGRFLIVDNDGKPLTSVVYNTAGLALSVILQNGTEAAITLAAAGDLLNRGKGIYEVAVPNSAYENLGDLTLCGVITDGAVVGFNQQVIAAPYTPDQIVRGIITGTVPNGSLARAVRDIKMADVLFEGQIVTAGTQSVVLDANATSVCFGQAITTGQEGDPDRQTRYIVGWDNVSKTAELDMPWCVIPANGRDYSIKVLRNALAGDADKSRAGSYGAAIADTKADTTTLLTNLATSFTKLFRWLGTIAGKNSDPTTLAEINATDAGSTYNNATDSLEALDEAIAEVKTSVDAIDLSPIATTEQVEDAKNEILLAISDDNPVGPGGIPKEITITKLGVPVDGAAVWVTLDIEGANLIAGTLYTDTFGNVTFMLEEGTYYAWVQKAEIDFVNPTEITVE